MTPTDGQQSFSLGKTERFGRWIQPVKNARPASEPNSGSTGDESVDPHELAVDQWGSVMLREARRRISDLAAVERQLEDRIRQRWEESAAEICEQRRAFEEEIAARQDSDAARHDAEEKRRQELRSEATKEGQATGFEAGFRRGREDGFRLGLDEGRREGLAQGLDQGRADGAKAIMEGLSGASRAMSLAARQLSESRALLKQEARSNLVLLALEVAKRILKQEVRSCPAAVLNNVAKAVDLVFRRGTLVLQVNPGDVPFVEEALKNEPRWAEGFELVEISPVGSVSRGGCRLISGAGVVDMTIETQLELVGRALQQSLQCPDLGGIQSPARPEEGESEEKP